MLHIASTAWKVSKYGVFSGYNIISLSCHEQVSLSKFLVLIQSECGKIRTRINSVFGYFSRNVVFAPGKQLTDTLIIFNFLLIFHLLISFTMEWPIIRAFFFSCLQPMLFIWSWVAAFISDCNRLSPELLLKLSFIFSNGAFIIHYLSQNQCPYLFYYFYRYSFNLILIFFVGLMKELLSWDSIFSFCCFELF